MAQGRRVADLPSGKRMDETPAETTLLGTVPPEADVERALRDEEAADVARRRYRAHGMVELVADEQIGPLLEPLERVYATRRAAALDRRQPLPAPGACLPGDLYVTSRRVIQVGCPLVALDLADIREVELSGNRLLLMLTDGSSVALAVDQPRLLRVEISAARAACRRSSRGAPVRTHEHG